MKFSAALGRNIDVPITKEASFASASGGTGSDPSVETVITGIPDLNWAWNPSALDQGLVGSMPNNRMRVREATIISESGSNTVASGSTNTADFRLNVWRGGTFMGTIAYYPLTVATTTASIIQVPFTTTTATAITGSSTTSIVVASSTNIVIGSSILLIGTTGADIGKTDYVTVSNVSGTTVTISTTTNSYSTTVTVKEAVVNTSASTTVTSGSTVIVPSSMNGIVANQVLYVYGGTGTPEYVKVASISAGVSFTATFVNAHSGNYYITSLNGSQAVGASQGIIGQAYPNGMELAVIPTAMTNIVPGMALLLNTTGATQEVVLVKSLIGTIGFTARFLYSHRGATNDTIKAAFVTNQQIPMIPAVAPNAATSNTIIAGATSTVITPNSIYGVHVNDWLQITGGAAYESAVTATTVATTTLTATFGAAHSGTTHVGYYVATTSATAVTAGATDTIVVADATNIVAGQSLILQGTGADSAKTNTMTVLAPTGTSIQFTAAIGTNSYSNTINVTSVAYLPATTTTVASKPSQAIAMASTTGIAAGDLVHLHSLAGNAATAAFSATTSEVVYVEAVTLNTSITISPTKVFTSTYAVVPFSKDTFATAVTSTSAATAVTLTTGSTTDNIFTGNVLYVWGGTGGTVDQFQVTAVSATNFTATPTYSHSGAYVINASGKTAVASSLGYAPSNNTTQLNEPYALIPGDVLTVTRLSNNGTGVATPLLVVEAELVPASTMQ